MFVNEHNHDSLSGLVLVGDAGLCGRVQQQDSRPTRRPGSAAIALTAGMSPEIRREAGAHPLFTPDTFAGSALCVEVRGRCVAHELAHATGGRPVWGRDRLVAREYLRRERPCASALPC